MQPEKKDNRNNKPADVQQKPGPGATETTHPKPETLSPKPLLFLASALNPKP